MRKQGTADDQIEALTGRIKDLEAVRAGNWTVREIDALQVRNEALAARVAELGMELASWDLFSGHMVDALALDRETIDAGHDPIGNVLLGRVRVLAARVKELEAAGNEGFGPYVVESLRKIREALKAAGLWRPWRDGEGGTADCAIEVIARVKELEEEVERELQGQVDISESGGRMYDKLSARIAELEDANLRAETEAQRLRELLESEQAEWEDALLALNKENRDLEGRNRDLEAVVAPLLPLFRERFEEWEEQILFDPHDDITITAEFPVEALHSLAKEEE